MDELFEVSEVWITVIKTMIAKGYNPTITAYLGLSQMIDDMFDIAIREEQEKGLQNPSTKIKKLVCKGISYKQAIKEKMVEQSPLSFEQMEEGLEFYYKMQIDKMVKESADETLKKVYKGLEYKRYIELTEKLEDTPQNPTSST